MKTDKSSVVRIANNLLSLSPVYIDTETTGFNNNDLVIEIAVMDNDGAVLLDTLVKSPKPIPAGASAVHGLNDIHLIGAPTWQEVWPQIIEVLKGRVVGIYNAAFDLRLIRQTCGLHGIRWEQPYQEKFCIMELFASYYGEWNPRKNSYKWKSLDFAGKYFKLPEPNSHRAKEDAYLSKLVLEAIANG
jgi:DNA polymerase III epsilon subunit-like protein